MSKQWQIRVAGRVQGVGYRVSACHRARELGLTGWVRNCPDGAVEMVVQGDEGACESLSRWCREGPPMARVEQMSVSTQSAPEIYKRFDVRGY